MAQSVNTSEWWTRVSTQLYRLMMLNMQLHCWWNYSRSRVGSKDETKNSVNKSCRRRQRKKPNKKQISHHPAWNVDLIRSPSPSPEVLSIPINSYLVSEWQNSIVLFSSTVDTLLLFMCIGKVWQINPLWRSPFLFKSLHSWHLDIP